VVEWRGCLEERPVVVAREDVVPVGDIEERGEPVAANSCQILRFGEEHRVRRNADQSEHQRLEQAPRAPRPEAGQRDAPRGAVLGEQQRRDQEARENEEEIDAEPAATELARVEEQNSEHADTPQPIEGRNVGKLGSRLCGHGASLAWRIRWLSRPESIEPRGWLLDPRLASNDPVRPERTASLHGTGDGIRPSVAPLLRIACRMLARRRRVDTDQDGFSDGAEVAAGSAPPTSSILRLRPFPR